MKSEQVAKDFFYKYYELGLDLPTAKECALIAVDEILKVVPRYYNDKILTVHGFVPVKIESCSYEYYIRVKKEIEAL